MTIKRIYRVYYDLPNYIVPKEVSKIFRKANEKEKLFDRSKHLRDKLEIEAIQLKIDTVTDDIKLITNVISPKHCNWVLTKLKDLADNKEFLVLTITEPVEESLISGGQDD